MYFIYLAIFILAILTPKIVEEGAFFFSEEDVESLLILSFGALGFALYLAREKALLKAFSEKLHLQKQTNIITRDLSDSYSYIGEMNRKLDIVKELIFRLPQEASEAAHEKGADPYHSILEAVRLLTKAKAVILRFVDIKDVSVIRTAGDISHSLFAKFDAGVLLRTKKTFWEEEGCAVVRSPKQANGTFGFIVFPKEMNHVEDVEILKILASEALFLFCVGHRAENIPKQ